MPGNAVNDGNCDSATLMRSVPEPPRHFEIRS